MFHATAFSPMWFSRNRQSMQRLMETHFWSLTRYRIGFHFIGLDYAGNVILFRRYRKQSMGGWTAVTLGSPGSGGIFSSDTTVANVLEDGYPMHYKASQELQLFVTKEKAKWEAARTAEIEEKKRQAGATSDSSVVAKKGEYSSASGEVKNPSFDIYDSDQRFRDTLILKCSHPKFFRHTLQLKPTVTLIYKCCYFYLWLIGFSFVIQGYLLFRSWVNPPARQGLIHLEEHALYIPRLLFAGFVTGIAWLVREAQPLIDPVVNGLSKTFPQVNWGVASAENLATRAENLAQDTHPAAKERKKKEEERKKKRQQEIKTRWMQLGTILTIFLAFLFIM